MSRPKKWQECHEEFIRQNAYKMKDKELALMLSMMNGKRVSEIAVKLYRQKMGILKWHGRGENYKWAGPDKDKG